MTRSTARRTLLAVILLITGPLAIPALAQAEQQAAEPTTLLTFEYTGGEHVLNSPKDAPLENAIRMIPLRLEELRRTLPDMQDIPPQATDVLFAVVENPVRFSLMNHGIDENTGMPRFGAVLSWKMVGDDPGEAAVALHNDIEFLRKMGGAPMRAVPSERYEGMNEVTLPFGVLSYGPRNAPDGWRYEVLFGETPDPDNMFDALPEPPVGMQVVTRARLDLAAWTPITNMFAGMAMMMIPNGQQIMADLRRRGIVGPDAIAYEFIEGYQGQSAVARLAARRIGRHFDNLALTKEPITDDDLRVIPSDAIAVSVTKFDAERQWETSIGSIRDQFAEDYERIMGQVNEVLGLDFESDLIPALGSTAACYLSDSTGAGAITSGVCVISLDDPETVRTAIDNAAARANEFLRSRTEGEPFAVRFSSFRNSGAQFIQLRFAGLPAPIEPTIAVAGNWLVIGMSPQASVAAALQTSDVKGGLLRNPSFAAHSNAFRNSENVGLFFIDLPQTMRTAYPYLAFGGSMLANFVRSPDSDEREPGLVVPPYPLLREGSRPLIGRTYWAGEDLVTEVRTDSSALVNAAGILGVGDMAPFIAGMITGGAIGSEIGKAGGFDAAMDDWDGKEPQEHEHEHEEEHEREKVS